MNTFYGQKLRTLEMSHTRKRIKSMQTSLKSEPVPEEETIFRKLERGLDKELQNKEVILDQTISLPAEPYQVKIQNKLWNYFIVRMEIVKDKVELQRLNFSQKQLISIKDEVIRKIEITKNNLSKLENSQRAKYEQIHNLFEEVMHKKLLKETLSRQATSKRKNIDVVANNGVAVCKIKENIEQIRKKIGKFDEEMKHSKKSLCLIEEQWKSFLVHLLKQGYYFQDGVTKILKQMISINYRPSKNDYPVFLDETSRRCLDQEYQRLRESIQSSKTESRTFARSQYLSQSKKNMRLLIKKQNLQKIYEGTKGYMKDWIMNEGWKQQVSLPRIQSTKEALHKKQNDWRSVQRKRLSYLQDKQKYKKIKAVMFGSKIEMQP